MKLMKQPKIPKHTLVTIKTVTSSEQTNKETTKKKQVEVLIWYEK